MNPRDLFEFYIRRQDDGTTRIRIGWAWIVVPIVILVLLSGGKA